MSDTFYPGWKAYVDERETKIYRADYAFRAIFVPSGKHTVIFSFNPKSFKIGAIISGVGVLLIVSYAIIQLKIFKNKSAKKYSDVSLSLKEAEALINHELKNLNL